MELGTGIAILEHDVTQKVTLIVTILINHCLKNGLGLNAIPDRKKYSNI